MFLEQLHHYPGHTLTDSENSSASQRFVSCVTYSCQFTQRKAVEGTTFAPGLLLEDGN